MNTISQLYFNCSLCDNYKCWEVVELCSNCTGRPLKDPCLSVCYFRAKEQHYEKLHFQVTLV